MISGLSQSAARDVSAATTVAATVPRTAHRGARREARIAHKNRRQALELDADERPLAAQALNEPRRSRLAISLAKAILAQTDVCMIAAAAAKDFYVRR